MYELLGEGASGGEGTVWCARFQKNLRGPLRYAIKSLNRPRGVIGDWPSREEFERWDSRIRLLRHIGLDRLVRPDEIFLGVPPHKKGEATGDPDVPYIVMEWVEGPTLDRLMDRIPADRASIVERMGYVAQVAQVLGELHSRTRTEGNPSLHCDVKPNNCIVHRARGSVLIDLSMVRLLDDGSDPLGMHTPGYAPPEVLSSPRAPRQPSADLYSLGALAAFCLLGEDPPRAEADTPRFRERVSAASRQAGVPDPGAFAAHLIAMLATDPALRPADGVAWAGRLLNMAAQRPGNARRLLRATVHPVTIPVLAAALIAGAIVLVPILDQESDAAPPGPSAGPEISATDRAPDVSEIFTFTPSPAQPVSEPSAAGLALPASGSSTGTSAPSPHGSAAASDDARNAPPGNPTPAPSTASGARAARPTGAITSPTEGASVRQCSYVSGTSAGLPSGRTLILAMRNLDNDDPERYVTYVFGWDEPAGLSSWRGVQYFGSGDSSVGQRYQVELIMIELSAAQAAENVGTDDAFNALAATGTVFDAQTVVRVAGGAPKDCEDR